MGGRGSDPRSGHDDLDIGVHGLAVVAGRQTTVSVPARDAGMHRQRELEPRARRLVIAPRQQRRATQAAGHVIRLQDLHHFPRFLHAASTPRLSSRARKRGQPTDQGQPRGERWPPAGRNPGRQWGISVAATGEVLMAAVGIHRDQTKADAAPGRRLGEADRSQLAATGAVVERHGSFADPHRTTAPINSPWDRRDYVTNRSRFGSLALV